MKKSKMNISFLLIILMVMLLTGCKPYGAKCSCGDQVELKQESSKD